MQWNVLIVILFHDIAGVIGDVSFRLLTDWIIKQTARKETALSRLYLMENLQISII